MINFIVVYRKHGDLNIETKFYGPFPNHDLAYDHLCTLPALGVNDTGDDAGCKYIDMLTTVQPLSAIDLVKSAPNLFEQQTTKQLGSLISILANGGGYVE